MDLYKMLSLEHFCIIGIDFVLLFRKLKQNFLILLEIVLITRQII